MRPPFFARMVFRICMILMLAAAAITAFSPILSFNSLLYPERIDSLYLRQEQLDFDTKVALAPDSASRKFIYSPAQIGSRYMHLSLTLPDNIVLRGWLVMDTTKRQGPLLLIIPDAGEGAIRYLYTLQLLAERGIHAAVIDLRAQGSSDGTIYMFANQSAIDLRFFIHQLRMLPFVTGVSVMGNGTGAATALETVLEKDIANALIMRNPPASLHSILERTALRQWGSAGAIFLPGMIRAYEKKAGLKVANYDYRKLIPEVTIPSLFLVTANAPKQFVRDARSLFEHADPDRKFWARDSTQVILNGGAVPEKTYLDHIASFVHENAPRKKKKSRFQKLAFAAELPEPNREN